MSDRAMRVMLWCCGIVLLALSVWFRVRDLSWVPGFHADEGFCGYRATRTLADGIEAWRAPSGPLVAPVHMLALAGLSLIFDPACWVPRFPVAVSGFATIILAYPLLRSSLGRQIAMASSLLFATNPGLITYARFGWGPSHGSLFGLLALGAALSGRTIWLLLMTATAYTVHPTNIFLAPIVVPVWLAARTTREQWFRIWRQLKSVGTACVTRLGRLIKQASGWKAQVALIASIVAVFAARYAIEIALIYNGYQMRIPYHWLDFYSWNIFATHVANLISGISFYINFSGMPADWVLRLHHVLVPATWCALLLGTIVSASMGQWRLPSLSLGILLGAAAIYLVAGAGCIRPGVERYGNFLLVPSIVALGWSLSCLARSVATRLALNCELVYWPLILGISASSLFFLPRQQNLWVNFGSGSDPRL
jgi:hypothetical protein